MKLRTLSSKLSLRGKRVLLRVDWNIPLDGDLADEDSLKLKASFETIKELSARGAIVVIATHLGRPSKPDKAYSTKRLQERVERISGFRMTFLPELVDSAQGLKALKSRIQAAEPGTIFLLENVRFVRGEESNTASIAKAFASLADLFVNDAFASCHRKHASVVGVAKYLPSYAGPSVVAEVDALSRLLKKPKKPFIAVIGGAKLSTKMPVISALLRVADRVMIGGAMAHPFFAAQGLEIGTSYLEKEGVAIAKKLLKEKKIILPVDAVVRRSAKGEARVVLVSELKKSDMIGDIGTATMQTWSKELANAKTIVWNGPLGMAEQQVFSYGSLVIVRAIAARSKGSCYGVVGGGDTLPIVARSGMGEWIDHLSMGGGAMLEFLAENGKLPGLTVLLMNKS